MDLLAFLLLLAAAVASLVAPRYWPALLAVGLVCAFTHPTGSFVTL